MKVFYNIVLYFSIVVLVALAIVAIVIFSYTQGYNRGAHENPQLNTTGSRYFEIYGIPKSQEEQCRFNYIIYRDLTECGTDIRETLIKDGEPVR